MKKRIRLKKILTFIICLCLVLLVSSHIALGELYADTQTQNSSNEGDGVIINGVYYGSFADYYIASGYTYIEKSKLIEQMNNQYYSGGDVNLSYFYKDDAGENLNGILIRNTGIYPSFASLAYKYILRTTSGKATLGGYQVMCYETDKSGQMYLSPAQLDAVNAKADAIIASSRAGTNAETVLNVFKWFQNNVSYDYTYYKGNAYNALIDNSCVCSGYASAFQLIMERAGIPSRIVTGKTSSGVSHAWNAVYIDGTWYYVDCTYGAYDSGLRWALFGTNMLADIYSIGIAPTSYYSANAGHANDLSRAEAKFYNGNAGSVITEGNAASIKAGTDWIEETSQEVLADEETTSIKEASSEEETIEDTELASNLVADLSKAMSDPEIAADYSYVEKKTVSRNSIMVFAIGIGILFISLITVIVIKIKKGSV